VEEVARRERVVGKRGGECRGERESDGGVCGVRGWPGARGRLGGVSMTTGITSRGGLTRMRGGPLVVSSLSLSLRFGLPFFLAVANF